MEQCSGCGAVMSPEATWCGQCYLPRHSVGTIAAPPITAPQAASVMSVNRQSAAASGAPPMVRTRWRKTPTTFGPVGRVLCTIGLLIPVPLLVIGTIVTGFGIVGLGIWVFILMPWGLRDVWKAGQLPAG